MTKINLLFFKIRSSQSLVKEMVDKYRANDAFSAQHIEDLPTLVNAIMGGNNAIFIFEVSNKEDLQNAVGVLKKHKELIASGALKSACFFNIRSQKAEKILTKYGCMDFLDNDTPTRTLSFKVDFWSKGVKKAVEKIEKNQSSYRARELKKATPSETQGSSNSKGFVNIPPLDIESDIWILNSPADRKKILRRWLVRLLGPSPHIGKWEESKRKPGLWRFDIIDKGQEYDDLIVDDGAWFFQGEKPDFDWKAKLWNFTSDSPHLFFQTKSGETHSRFKLDHGQIEITENSMCALMKKDMIISSLNREYIFETDEEEVSDEEFLENLKKEKSKNKRLGSNDMSDLDFETEIKSDQGSGDQLSGRVNTDHIDTGPLSGSVLPEGAIEDLLDGQNSTDHIDTGPLSGSVLPEGAIEDLLDGQNSTDHIDTGPLSGSVLPEGAIEDLLDGETSTDHIENGPMSGEISSEAAIDGNLDGKGSTEHINNEALNGNILQESMIDEVLEKANLERENEEESNANAEVVSEFDSKESGKRRASSLDSEEGMFEALSGGLTNNEQLEKENSLIDLSTVVGELPQNEVSYESGVVKSIIKQITESGSSVSVMCEFEDFFEKELIVQVPLNSLEEGAKVHASIILAYASQKVKIESSGIIEVIENVDEKKANAIIILEDILITDYERFIDLYQSRQENINDFMKNAKGF